MTKLEMKGMLIVLKFDRGYFVRVCVCMHARVCVCVFVCDAQGSLGAEVRQGQMPYTAEDHA